MKVLWFAGFFCLLTSLGCVSTRDKGATGTSLKVHEPPPPSVMPAQVQPENARKISQALWDEMDRQAQDEMLKESAAKPVPSKK